MITCADESQRWTEGARRHIPEGGGDPATLQWNLATCARARDHGCTSSLTNAGWARLVRVEKRRVKQAERLQLKSVLHAPVVAVCD